MGGTVTENITRLLRDTYDRCRRDEAYRALDDMMTERGMFPALLEIVLNTKQRPSVRQGAANHLEKWMIALQSYNLPPGVSQIFLCDEDMEAFKTSIISAVVHAQTPDTQSKLLICFQCIALLEFRHRWTSLSTSISELIQSSSDKECCGGLLLILTLVRAHINFKPMERIALEEELVDLLILFPDILSTRPSPTPSSPLLTLEVVRLVLLVMYECLNLTTITIFGSEEDHWKNYTFIFPHIELILEESLAQIRRGEQSSQTWMEVNEWALANVDCAMSRHMSVDDSTQAVRFFVHVMCNKVNKIIVDTVQLLISHYFPCSQNEKGDKALLNALFVILHSVSNKTTRPLIKPSLRDILIKVILPLLNYGPLGEYKLTRTPPEFVLQWFVHRGETSVVFCATRILGMIHRTFESSDGIYGPHTVSILANPESTPQQKFGCLYAAGLVANALEPDPNREFIIPPSTFFRLMTATSEPVYLRMVACYVAGFLCKFKCKEKIYFEALKTLTSILDANGGSPEYLRGIAAISIQSLSDNTNPRYHSKLGRGIRHIFCEFLSLIKSTNDAYELAKNLTPLFEDHVTKLEPEIGSICGAMCDVFISTNEANGRISKRINMLGNIVGFVVTIASHNSKLLSSLHPVCTPVIKLVVEKKLFNFYYFLCKLIHTLSKSKKEAEVRQLFPPVMAIMGHNSMSFMIATETAKALIVASSSVIHDVSVELIVMLKRVVTKHFNKDNPEQPEILNVLKTALEFMYATSVETTTENRVTLLHFALDLLDKYGGQIPTLDAIVAKIIFCPLVIDRDWEFYPAVADKLNPFMNKTVYQLRPARVFHDGPFFVMGLCALIEYRIGLGATRPMTVENNEHVRKLLVKALKTVRFMEKEGDKVGCKFSEGPAFRSMFKSILKDMKQFDERWYWLVLSSLTPSERAQIVALENMDLTEEDEDWMCTL